MQVRRAQAEDVEAIAMQMKEVVDEGGWLATESNRSAEDLAERFRSGLGAGDVLIVAEEGGQIIGSAGVHPTGVDGVLSVGMSILADHRGRGGGRQLIEAAIEAAREVGARKLELDVFVENARAIALYASAGFEVEGVKRDHYRRLDGSLRSVLLMTRFLEP